MPDVQTLIEKKLKIVSKPSVDLVSESGEENEDSSPVQIRRKKKQRAVVESDSDE